MTLPAASVGETCTCYRIDEVRSVRKLVSVGFTTPLRIKNYEKARNNHHYNIDTAPSHSVVRMRNK